MPEITLTQAPAHLRMGSSIGQPLTRREGVLKTTGAARFAADNHPSGMVYAALAVSSIARGRVAALDVAAAKAHPGVIEVMTPANAPKLALDPDAKNTPFMFRLDLLQNGNVRYANQPVAVVVADTLEAATEGAALLAPQYEAEPARTGLDSDESFAPPAVGAGSPAEESHGDVAAGLAAASVRMEAVYDTPAQYHNAMEPHAIVAVWDGDTLSIGHRQLGYRPACEMRLSRPVAKLTVPRPSPLARATPRRHGGPGPRSRSPCPGPAASFARSPAAADPGPGAIAALHVCSASTLSHLASRSPAARQGQSYPWLKTVSGAKPKRPPAPSRSPRRCSR